MKGLWVPSEIVGIERSGGSENILKISHVMLLKYLKVMAIDTFRFAFGNSYSGGLKENEFLQIYTDKQKINGWIHMRDDTICFRNSQ